jgi:hypothetical protein
MKGESSTNIILFLTVLIAAMILTVWYIEAVRPTRYIIGAVTNDMESMQQHIANACTSSVYEAAFVFSTKTGFFMTNSTHFCIYTEVFGSCKPHPYSGCQINATRITLESTRIQIRKNATLEFIPGNSQ